MDLKENQTEKKKARRDYSFVWEARPGDSRNVDEARYRVDIDLSKPVMQCNCSICSRTGTLLSFVPVSAFTLEKGEGSLTDYQFGRQHLHHLFCKVCGVHSFAQGMSPDGTDTRAVNVRCLEGVDPWSMKPAHFDGKSR